ncbi:MAG: iron-containing alcohol dehydrogenase [Candidatus Thorarchaeota archaeon]
MSRSEILHSVVPRTIVIGSQCFDRITTVISAFGFIPKVLVLTGPKTREIAGIEVFDIMANQDYDYETLVVENTVVTPEVAETYVDIVNKYKPNVLVAAGGGRIIEIGKYCLSKSSGQMEMISVPTSTPHDGIASPFIFLDDPTETFIGECRPPIAVIADVDKIAKHPNLVRYLAAGVGDTLGKITAIWDWRHAYRIKSERYSRFVGGVLENADTLFQNQVSEALIDPDHAIQVVLKALLIAGVLMGTSNDIRVGYGSEHMFAASLAAELHDTSGSSLLHGERVALGTILMSKLQNQNYQNVKNLLETAGCPVTIDDFEEDIPSEVIINALLRAHKMSPIYTILGRSGLTKVAALRLAQSTGVIESIIPS